MNAELSDSLRIISRVGAESFGSTTLAADLRPTVRRVGRRRAARVVGTSAAAVLVLGAMSLTAFAVGTQSPVVPGVSPSITPTQGAVPNPQISYGGDFDCDGSSEWLGTNGNLSEDSLCTLWDGVNRLRSDAAVALTQLDAEFRAEFGRDICIISSYRTLADQERVAESINEAAPVGQSQHGWGIAVDFCPGDDRGEPLAWLQSRAGVYGWENPTWAQGPDQFEPWHWEFNFTVALGTLIIPDGLGLNRTLERIAEASGLPLSALTDAAANSEAIGLPPEAGGSIDGWVLGDMYRLEPAATAEEVLSQLVAHTVETLDGLGVAPEDRERVLILASLVEAESKLTADMPKVARVIFNRLDANLPLQLDSTVRYAVGANDIVTSDEERAVNSPYNTFASIGLPPGPINSPGVDAIKAVLHPADGPWLYFITVDLDAGTTWFTTTYADYLAGIDKLNAWIRENL